jgi:hypothetical protein
MNPTPRQPSFAARVLNIPFALLALAFAGGAHALETQSAGYLVEQYLGSLGKPVSIISGWDLDRSGGYLSNVWQGLTIVDNSATAGVSMRRPFLRQTAGQIVLEYRFNASQKVDGITWQLQSGTQTVVNIFTSGGNLCYENTAGAAVALQAYSANTEVGVKVVANVSARTADVYVNGRLKALGTTFRNPVDGIDRFFLYTGTAGTLTLNQRSVQIHKGYLINERFLAQAPGVVPDGWTTTASGGQISVIADPDATPLPDCNLVQLSDTSRSSNVSLAKTFATQTTNQVTAEFNFMQPNKNDGFEADFNNGSVSALRIITDQGNLCYVDAGGNKVSLWDGYRSNMWYLVRCIIDLSKRTADITINDIPRATGVGLSTPSVSQVDTIKFSTSVANTDVVWLDDIRVYPQSSPLDYVPVPVPVPHSPYLIGAQACDLWREGSHLGWDWISSDPDRSPVLGFYDDGNPEAADWAVKYMVDHGIDFYAPCWYRPGCNTGHSPIKDGNYCSAGLNAYKRAKYSSFLRYSLIIETSNGPVKDMHDWTNNVVPFLIEHYFKDPRFLVISNKPVVCFFGGIQNTGDEPAARNYLIDQCVAAGFAGATLIGCTTAGPTGFEYTYTYCQQFTAESVTNHISSPSVNWDTSGWALPFQDAGTWRSAATYQNLLIAQKACMPSKTGLAHTMLLLDNWNEYGEGHFLMPTEGFGFGYLDAIRQVFGDGSPHTDVLPTIQQKTRINVLYPQPRIIVQPSDQKAVLGQSATFSVSAIGIPPRYYQWSKDGRNIINATNAAFAFSPALPENQGSHFSVLVSNTMGQIASDDAILNVFDYSPVRQMKVSFTGYNRSEGLKNFPVLIKFAPGLTNGFAYSQLSSPLGYDLRFKDATQAQELNYEVESWDTNGESCVWVQVPLLTTNTFIWASWGDFRQAQSPPDYTTNGATWDISYGAVWHMSEGAGTKLRDSSANTNSGTLYQNAAWTAGPAGNALLFNGTTSYASAGTGTSLSLTNRFTLSAWVCPLSYHTNGYYKILNGFLSRGPSSATTLNYALETKNSTTVTFIKRMPTEGLQFYDFTVPTLTSNWTLVTMAVANGILSLSVNGTPCGSRSVGTLASVSGTDTLYLGAIDINEPETTFAGGLDEVRICNTVVSTNQDWANWLNMASNSTFVSVGRVSGGPADADANGNGLPDLWEIYYFGTTNAVNGGPDDDWDHDWMSNLAEYLAGTCPTNAASVLRLTEPLLNRTSGTMQLSWPSVGGRMYTIQTATNLLTGFNGMETNHIAPTPPSNTYTIHLDQSKYRFYRVMIEP